MAIAIITRDALKVFRFISFPISVVSRAGIVYYEYLTLKKEIITEYDVNRIVRRFGGSRYFISR